MNYQLYLQLVGSPGGIRGDKQFRWKDHVGIHKKDARRRSDQLVVVKRAPQLREICYRSLPTENAKMDENMLVQMRVRVRPEKASLVFACCVQC
jgi:hypothetical protein